VHGWCRCHSGWYGVDCSDAVGLRYRRAELHDDGAQFGEGPRSAQWSLLPLDLRAHVQRLRRAIYVYDLPAHINRAHTERWMWRQWGKSKGQGCDPVHNRRIYSAQSHFDSHLLHDDYIRTSHPERALLYYVPVFLNQRVTWGADLNETMRPALEYIRMRYPFWNASGGRDHVWFVFGERQTCLVPDEIASRSIIIGHWGDESCVARDKDVIVPTITPVQHDLPRFKQRLRPAMRKSAASSFARSGPLLFFAGGITSYGASQDNIRKMGKDSVDKQQKWLTRVLNDKCSRPDKQCRNIYSMGVRQAVWRQRLWAEPDMRVVSAGVPDYLTAVPQAHFCLHTEGNGWGARVVDYMAMECLPLMVNDRMVFPYDNVLRWHDFSLHLRKREIPQIPTILRNMSDGTQQRMHHVLRQYKRGFVWWRPDGLAYEYTLAALGQRAAQFGFARKSPTKHANAKEVLVATIP